MMMVVAVVVVTVIFEVRRVSHSCSRALLLLLSLVNYPQSYFEVS